MHNDKKIKINKLEYTIKKNQILNLIMKNVMFNLKFGYISTP